jgi:flagellar hook-associated protein 2
MAALTFSGIASGLDTQALIDATTNASRQSKVKPSQTRVTELTATNTAFEELTTKLETLQSNLRQFSTLEGGGVSKTGTSSKESVVSATATASATNASYEVTVNTLASNHTYSFNNTYASPTSAIQSTLTGAEPVANRTVTFTVGTGGEQETVSVEITNGSYTVQNYVDAFNAASTKARASLVNVGTTASPSYKIVLTSLYEGTSKGTITRTALGAALTNLSGFSQSAAANASVTITGIGTITRTSNSISDIIPGVTLSLSSTGTATVKIAEDVPATITRVQDFVDSWNDIVTFLDENNRITTEQDGQTTKNTFAPLSSSRIDDNALFALRSALSATVASGGSAVRVFADLGITTQRDGTLRFDTAKLQEAISAEVSSVSSVLTTFADSVALTNGTVDQYVRFNGLLDTTIQANQTTIDDLNKRIAEAEAQIQRQADQLRQRYARLESQMGKLQSQQQSLTAALSGLG